MNIVLKANLRTISCLKALRYNILLHENAIVVKIEHYMQFTVIDLDWIDRCSMLKAPVFCFWFQFCGNQDEWVISRVFQKSGTGANGSSCISGGMKPVTSGMNCYQEVNSSTSVTLPPLLDSSSYASAISAYTADPDSYSYDSNAASKEHVPCFSTAPATTYDSHFVFDLPPPPLSASTFTGPAMDYQKNVGVSSFPSLRALQENLQLPFFYSSVAPPQPPIHGDGAMCSYANSSGGNWLPAVSSATEIQKPGPTELDCIWSFWSIISATWSVMHHLIGNLSCSC